MGVASKHEEQKWAGHDQFSDEQPAVCSGSGCAAASGARDHEEGRSLPSSLFSPLREDDKYGDVREDLVDEGESDDGSKDEEEDGLRVNLHRRRWRW